MTSAAANSAEPARAWLERVLRLFARNAPLGRYQVTEAPGELLLELELEGVSARLAVRPKDDQPAWAHTRLLSLTITSNTEDDLPRETEHQLLLLKSLLHRAEPLALEFPTRGHAPLPEHPPIRFLGRMKAPALEERARSQGELAFAAYVAWRAISTEDLYPHVSELGDLITPREVLDGWERTLGRVRAGTAPDKVGLYVHIPFCAVACHYCYCGKTDQFDRAGFDAYVDDLIVEMQRYSEVFAGTPLTSVYFGGGTPSLLPPAALERVLGEMHRAFDVPDGTQIIFEGNPDSLSEKKIEILAKVGRVSRLTVGVQTLDPEAQRRARRHNRPEEVSAAVAAAKKHGIAHVNVDLMAGLDGQSLQSFKDDMDFVLGLGPDSIHINAFRPNPRTKYALDGQEMSDEQRELRDQMLAWGTDRLQGGGYSHLDQGQGKTRDAANIQDYDLRRVNGSLLGLGNPARSHSFASHYYGPEVPNGDIVAALLADREGRRRVRAVPVDDMGEAHRFLVHNLHTGFSLSHFRALWGKDPWEVCPHGFGKLQRLGVVQVDGDRVETDPGDHADMMIHRVFLYGEQMYDRVMRAWGSDYDTRTDYGALLDKMCEKRLR